MTELEMPEETKDESGKVAAGPKPAQRQVVRLRHLLGEVRTKAKVAIDRVAELERATPGAAGDAALQARIGELEDKATDLAARATELEAENKSLQTLLGQSPTDTK